MKILFLDVDGVLNSMTHYHSVKNITEDPLDSASIHCLAQIIAATDATIVLTSTWRGGWHKDPDRCQVQGKILNRYLKKEGLEIYDSTPSLDICDGSVRCQEILLWMKRCPYKIESYAIIDDADYHWENYGLSHRWIRTDFNQLGLEEKHVAPAIALLNKKEKKLFFRNLFRRSF